MTSWGRSAYFIHNTIESSIIFSFILVKITFEFTANKKVHPGGARMRSWRIYFNIVLHAVGYSYVPRTKRLDLEAPIFAVIFTLTWYLRLSFFIKILDVLDLNFQGQIFHSPHWWVDRTNRWYKAAFFTTVGHQTAIQWHIRRLCCSRYWPIFWRS